MKFNLNLEKHKEIYAQQLHSLHWNLVVMALMAEQLDSVCTDAVRQAENLYLESKTADRMLCKRMMNNLSFCQSAVKTITQKYTLDKERLNAVYDIADIMSDLNGFLKEDADLSKDKVNSAIKNYRKLIDSLRKKQEWQGEAVKEWKAYVDTLVAETRQRYANKLH